MKKICLITTVTITNKAFLVPTAEYYRANTDWDISLMCALDDPAFLELVPEGVRFLPVPMKRGISLAGISACFKMWRIFRREKFDLIQYSTPNASLYASIAGLLAGVKVRLYCQWGMIYVSQEGLRRWIFKTMEKVICRLSTHVQPDSFGNLEVGQQEGLYPKGKGSVVWNGSACGIDMDKFDISQKPLWRKEIREELQIPEDATVFGFVGRITGDKGVNELFAAFQKLAERDPNAWLLMVGPMEKEETVDMTLYNWAQEHPRVRLCGFRSDVAKLLSAMDCYVLPSYREGFGISIIEAEAMELPVITTDIPGPREAIAQGVTGITVRVRSAESLLEGMEKMAADEALRLRFGKAARQYVAERFEYNRFLEEILKDRKGLLGEEK